MKENNLTSLGQINGNIMAEWVNERFAGWSPPKAKALRKPMMTDEAWIAELQSEPIGEGLDVHGEFVRCALWCKTNGKQPTRRRFTQWLLRASKDKTMAPRASSGPALPLLEAPVGWGAWTQDNLPECGYIGLPWAKWPRYAQEQVCRQMIAEKERTHEHSY